MKFKKFDLNQSDQLFKLVKILSGDATFSKKDLHQYLLQIKTDESFSIFVCEINNTLVGMISCFIFPLTRYLGMGVTIEEISVLSDYRRRGIGKFLLTNAIEHYSTKVRNLRKFCIRTDDENGSGKLYEQFFKRNKQIEYSKFVKKL